MRIRSERGGAYGLINCVAAPEYSAIIAELSSTAARAHSAGELMSAIVQRLATLPAFNWAGFYMIERGRAGEPEQMLVLEPFVGAPTPHQRIPLNQGICGAAASSGETVVVDDVHADPRYLACSIETRSEIVAPVRVRGQVAGELDIDSHAAAAFGRGERELVESCARMVGEFLEQRA